MKLPRRKHYTIESAAKRLGVDADEVKYHLSEGTIRYALPNHTSKDDDNHWVKFDQLSDIAKNCVYQCVKIKDWAIHELFKEYGVDRLVRDVALAPEYLYLPNSFPVANVSHIGVMNEGDGEPWGSAIMELLSGEQVIKLASGYPHYFIIGDRDEQGAYLDAVITEEELSKFDDIYPESQPEPVEEVEEEWQPFTYGKRNSGGLTSEAITVFGNSFYEEYGAIPSDRELWDYLRTCKKHPNYRINFLRQLEGTYRDVKVNDETAIDYETWRKRVERRRNVIPSEISKKLKV